MTLLLSESLGASLKNFHDDNYLQDNGIQVTIAFRHFGVALVQRMPRCRHGYIHMVIKDQEELHNLPSAYKEVQLLKSQYLERVKVFELQPDCSSTEHHFRNYRSITTVHGFDRDGRISTIVLELYVVDEPEGNSEEDTHLFVDTIVKLNL